MMVEQLSVWEMFKPMSDPLAEIYDDLYGSLCEDTHLIPGKTMMGRLMVVGKNPSTVFEPSQEEFDRFLGLLHRVAEIGAICQHRSENTAARRSESTSLEGRWLW
jgi:hypothetical protein